MFYKSGKFSYIEGAFTIEDRGCRVDDERIGPSVVVVLSATIPVCIGIPNYEMVEACLSCGEIQIDLLCITVGKKLFSGRINQFDVRMK